jgi:phage terminase large subunit
MKLSFDTYWNEKQKLAFNYLLNHPEITEIGYGWWAGWWKSYTWVAWQWMMCNKYPWYRGFFGRQELKRLKQTTLATYFKFLWDYSIPESQKGNYNAQDSVIKFQNWSEILLLDLAYLPSDPLYTRFWSLELTGGYIDESAEIDGQCISILSTRVWRWKNEEYWLAPKILEWFNPDKWHVYRRFYKPSVDWTLPKYRVFIPALATDNKRLPKSYIEQLEKTNEVTKQRLLYGNFDYDDTPWRLFDYKALLNMWDNPPINWEKYISWDIARKGKDKSLVWFWNGLELYKIIREDKTDLKELSDLVRQEAQKEWVRMSNTIMDENWVWWGIIDNLRCQWFINNARPRQPKKSNISTVRNYDMLKTQCYFKLAEMVNTGQITISIEDPDFKEKLIEELDIIVEVWLDQDWKVKIIKKEDMIAKLWRSPDMADMLMMRMYYELDKRSPVEKEEEKEDENDPLWIFKNEEINEFDIDFSVY